MITEFSLESVTFGIWNQDLTRNSRPTLQRDVNSKPICPYTFISKSASNMSLV